MNLKKLYAAAFAAFILTGAAFQAEAGPKKDEKKKLSAENIRLRTRIDSLCRELDLFRQKLHQSDSLNKELAKVQSEERVEETRRLQIEEYTTEVSDSLLDLWYTRENEENDVCAIELGSTRLTSDIPDSVYMRRLKDMNSFFTLPYNEIVRDYLIQYSEKMKSGMKRIMGLSEYYMPIFQETFNRYGLPEELKAMAIIESSLNPTAVSRAGAKGMWQFMYNTAKRYGLHIDSFVDERLDPVKSADAAARYLKDAYHIFGDWNLAIASYNCGAGNVQKAIKRAGGKREFWDIWPYLPTETRGYVPAFVGALYALKYHKEHGIEAIETPMPVHTDTFRIRKMLHLKQVSELTGAPLEHLKTLNPQYQHEIIPGNDREYILRIPYKYTDAFIAQEDSLYRHKDTVYFNPLTIKKIKEGGDGHRIVYKVRSGDYLGKIAERYRVTVSQIKKWNGLRSNNLSIGQRLVIYSGRGAVASASSSSAATSAPKGNSAANAKGHSLYTVKDGDSFYLIAKNYPGVSAQNIMDYNGITSTSLRPGSTIKIPIF